MKIRDIVKYRKEIEMLKPERHVLIIYNDGNSEIHEWGDGTIIEVPDDFSFENVFIIIHRHSKTNIFSQIDLVLGAKYDIYVGVVYGKKLKVAKATARKIKLPDGREGLILDKVEKAYEYNFKNNKWRKLHREKEIYNVMVIRVWRGLIPFIEDLWMDIAGRDGVFGRLASTLNEIIKRIFRSSLRIKKELKRQTMSVTWGLIATPYNK